MIVITRIPMNAQSMAHYGHWGSTGMPYTGGLNSVRTMYNQVKQNFTNMLNAVKTIFTTVKTTITNAWENVMVFLRSINLYDIGKNIIQGLINGIGALATNVYNKMKDIGTGMLDTFKGVLGIHSPAREMIEAGKDTVAGLNVGMTEEQKKTEQVMKDLGGVILKTEKDTKSNPESKKKADEEIQKVWTKAARNNRQNATRLIRLQPQPKTKPTKPLRAARRNLVTIRLRLLPRARRGNKMHELLPTRRFQRIKKKQSLKWRRSSRKRHKRRRKSVTKRMVRNSRRSRTSYQARRI